MSGQTQPVFVIYLKGRRIDEVDMKTYPNRILQLNVDVIRKAFDGRSRRIRNIAEEIKTSNGHQKYALGDELGHGKKVDCECCT